MRGEREGGRERGEGGREERERGREEGGRERERGREREAERGRERERGGERGRERGREREGGGQREDRQTDRWKMHTGHGYKIHTYTISAFRHKTFKSAETRPHPVLGLSRISQYRRIK